MTISIMGEKMIVPGRMTIYYLTKPVNSPLYFYLKEKIVRFFIKRQSGDFRQQQNPLINKAIYYGTIVEFPSQIGEEQIKLWYIDIDNLNELCELFRTEEIIMSSSAEMKSGLMTVPDDLPDWPLITIYDDYRE